MCIRSSINENKIKAHHKTWMIRFGDSLPYLSTRHSEPYRTLILLPPHHPRSLFFVLIAFNVRVDYVNERRDVFFAFISAGMSTTEKRKALHIIRRDCKWGEGKDSHWQSRGSYFENGLILLSSLSSFPFIWRRLTSFPLFQGDRCIVKSLTTIF